jgi:adenylate cyclase
MSNVPTASGQCPDADRDAEIAALRSAVQRLETENHRLRERTASVANANANAAELMVKASEAETALTAQNQRLQKEGSALANANANAAELMVELEEAQSTLTAQNHQLQEQGAALASANANAAELMVELEEAQGALAAQNQRLQEQGTALATANANAAELMVELEEAQGALGAQNQRLQEQSTALADANANAAELMVELEEAQSTLTAQNQRLQEQGTALATANANAAELMAELEEAQGALTAQNQRLQQQSTALAIANANATELMVDLEEAQQLLREQNSQLDLHNRFIRQTFGRYLTNEIVASLLDSPTGLEIGGEKRKVTLLMSDLRGFTTLSERLHPEQVVTILNRHLGAMVDVILRYHGTIDEFIGDAILVIFGAPVQRADDAQRAVACAVEMQLAMEHVNALNRRDGLPEVEMGIGIHTGEVVVGNIGSDKRTKYGVVGRNINLTSRIESCTVGSQILVSEVTHREVGSLMAVAEQMQVLAKGIETPITIYDVRGVGAPYNLILPITEDPLLPLPMPLPLRYTVVEDKRLRAVALAGRLVKVAAKGGEIRARRVVAPLSDIKIHLTDGNGHDVPGTLYGKVLPYAPKGGHGFPVRFTVIAPETARFLERLIALCSPG